MADDKNNAVVAAATTQAPGGNGATTVDYKAKFEEASKELSQAQHTIVELKKDSKTPTVDLEEIKKQLSADEEFKKGLISGTPSAETVKKLEETQAALQSEVGKNKGGSASSVKIPTEEEIKLSPQERELVNRLAQRRKISFEDAAKIFKK